MLAVNNCKLVFGEAKCPANQKEDETWAEECLVGVRAIMDIPAGAELLLDYGPHFWDNMT